MERKRIAIACQGGGSQCAFVAGALKTLFAGGVHRQYEVVGLSGTSGGALTAALAWIGILKEARGDRSPIGDRILACWNDLTAQTPKEIFFDNFCVQMLRMIEGGMLPSIASSPSSKSSRLGAKLAASLFDRPEFVDLRALIVKHMDFAALPDLVEPDSPVLLVGAADVLEGTFKIFSSVRGEITPESLLGSAAVPTLFPAVWVDGHAYWDGIFSTNPPITGFLRRQLMGRESLPDEIWIIQVNPTRIDNVPETAGEIGDRRNQLAGNLSLQHELDLVDMVNVLLEEHALTECFRRRFGLDASVPIKVRFIRMSEDLLLSLDSASKLSRQPSHISRLIADGETQALEFLAQLAGAEQAPGPTRTDPMVGIH
jgi:NTE family protein